MTIKNLKKASIISLLIISSLLTSCNSTAQINNDEIYEESSVDINTTTSMIEESSQNKETIEKEDESSYEAISKDKFSQEATTLVENLTENAWTENGLDYQMIHDKLNDLKNSYISVDDENEISTFIQMLDQLNTYYETIDIIDNQYGNFANSFEWTMTQEFYVLKRLKTVYSDTITGSLEKELDQLSPQDEIYWLATNVDYFSDTSPIGNDTYVLETNEPGFFSQQGSYNLAYLDTGDTLVLEDEFGFQQEVPLYQIIGHATQVQSDIDLLKMSQTGFLEYWTAIQRLFTPDYFDFVKTEKDKILDFSGDYHDDFDSIVRLSVFEPAKNALLADDVRFMCDIGTIYYEDSQSYSTMYLLGGNLYLVCGDYGYYGLIGVYQEDGITKIHFYGQQTEEYWEPVN